MTLDAVFICFYMLHSNVQAYSLFTEEKIRTYSLLGEYEPYKNLFGVVMVVN